MHKLQGMTLLRMLVTGIAVIIFAALLMQIIPVYMQNYEVKHSIDTLQELDAGIFSNDWANNATILKSRLINQFSINGLNDLKPEQINITPNDNGQYLVSVNYVVTKPLIYNVSLLFEFHNLREISVGSQ